MKINILLPVTSITSSLGFEKVIRAYELQDSCIYNIVSTSTFLSLNVYQKIFRVFLKSSPH